MTVNRPVAEWIRRARLLGRRKDVRMTAVAIALPLFMGGVGLAWRQSGLDLDQIRPWPIALIACAVPLTVLLSTWQLRLIADMSGTSVGLWSASRVVTLGTLSGLLPVSSATLVRGGAVLYWGGGGKETARAFVFDGLLWLGLGMAYSGGAAYLLGALDLALVLLASGLAGVLASSALAARWRIGAGRAAALATARLGGVVTDAARLLAAFFALGVPIGIVDASVLAAATPLAALIFILPGGLGVREAFAAAAAVAIGIEPGIAFLAAGMNRIVGLLLLLFWEGIVLAVGLAGSSGAAGSRGEVPTDSP